MSSGNAQAAGAAQGPRIPCDAWCSTDLNTTETSKATFVWTIEGFANHRASYTYGTRETSEEFTLTDPDGKDTKWVLDCYPNGDNNYPGYVIVNLRTLKASSLSTDIKVETFYLDSSGNKTSLTSTTVKFGGSLTLMNAPFGNINTTDLTLVCELTILGSKKTSFGRGVFHKKLDANMITSYQKVGEDLQSLLFSKDLSDVEIKCGEETFDAHQAILSARSPVFGRMLRNEMTEKKSKLVEIKELEPRVLAEMLKFIYTGSSKVTEEDPDLQMTADLLVAAERYQLEILKSMCESILASCVTTENCLQVRSWHSHYLDIRPLLIVYSVAEPQ